MNQSLEVLYRRHRQGLFSMAVAITGSHQLAEDAVHNAFARMVRRGLPDSAPDSGESVAYVYKAVKNSAVDLCRSHQRQSRVQDSLFNGFQPPRHVERPEEKLLTEERHQLLRKAVDRLSEHEREAVVLKAFGQLTFEQAADVAGVPVKTLATRYRRALANLAEKLVPEQE